MDATYQPLSVIELNTGSFLALLIQIDEGGCRQSFKALGLKNSGQHF